MVKIAEKILKEVCFINSNILLYTIQDIEMNNKEDRVKLNNIVENIKNDKIIFYLHPIFNNINNEELRHIRDRICDRIHRIESNDDYYNSPELVLLLNSSKDELDEIWNEIDNRLRILVEISELLKDKKRDRLFHLKESNQLRAKLKKI